MTVLELNPTKLGTKEHWDDVYDQELKSFEDLGEEGEVWFGEETVEKMVDWCIKNIPPAPSQKILEVGCGNGTLILGLLEAGYSAETLHGIDYSEGAVNLARAVAAARKGSGITYTRRDFLKDDSLHPNDSAASWDLLLDKGTLDAIALAQKDEKGRSLISYYPAQVARLLKTGGIFLITSCNFTEEELKEIFTSDRLDYLSRIKHPAYTFGGKSGSAYASVAFRRTSA
ncbi:S-adenosyl-L-methionine-dependent methyltransferase [Crepidotus variabilis]|uniref:Protein-lysine N-methyltransferase EFM4 n=1 Tax=Crepidotus variabilis TaxID=179855 RepID=A0A9P6JMD5_9AGAR|nr:S-adenosyl-L-methionine-dependent methyltransferase [Crepidotus variabilis]